jgi:hypothetical protein
MEDILDVYTHEQDPHRPLVCMDERPKQLIGETRSPIPAEPGKPSCFDMEYVRNGTCDIFMFAVPLEGNAPFPLSDCGASGILAPEPLT